MEGPFKWQLHTVPSEFWIVVTQWDRSPTAFQPADPPRGPLVHEAFCLSEDEARDRCRGLGDRYGWAVYVRVHPFAMPIGRVQGECPMPPTDQKNDRA